MNNEKKNNEMYLRGRIASEVLSTHEFAGEVFYEFLVEVPRLSGNADVLPVTVSERLVSFDELVKGRELCIYGELRSYNRLEDGRSRLKLTVFVQAILEDLPCALPNDIELRGYVCKPPVYRTTPNDREITDVLLAVNRGRKSDYIPCIVWGRNAKFAESLQVGNFVSIKGRVQSRVYHKKYSETDIRPMTAYEVSCSCIAQEEQAE